MEFRVAVFWVVSRCLYCNHL